MTDFEKNMNIIHKLQDVGFRVEIDDFGSGYSSLNMLKDISADVLKSIWASFANLRTRSRDRIY